MEAPFVLTDRLAGNVALIAYAIFFAGDAVAIRAKLGSRDSNQDRGSKGAIFLLQGVGLALGFLLAYLKVLRLPGSPWPWVVAGSALLVAGTLLRLWSIRTLGQFFTRDVGIREGHRLVTGGPYRWLLHPSYAAALLAFLGIGLVFGSWLSVVATTLFATLSYLNRIRVEEQALREHFGDEFERYSAARSRLIPRIW